MKMHFFIFLVPLLFACKKEGVNSLVGKWRLVQIYNGRTSVGCLCWANVPPSSAEILEFTLLGQYTMTPVTSGSSCAGHFRIVNDTTIALSICMPTNVQMVGEINRRFSKTNDELIIDYDGIDGVFRYEYRRQ